MKKYLIMFLCLSAWNCNPIYADDNQVDLDVEIVDESPNLPGKSKVPMRMPRIYQDGYTLTLSSFHPEYLINIIQDGEVVYSSIIPAGVTVFELPTCISGECTVQFISGRFCLKGLIVL